MIRRKRTKGQTMIYLWKVILETRRAH